VGFATVIFNIRRLLQACAENLVSCEKKTRVKRSHEKILLSLIRTSALNTLEQWCFIP